MNRRRMSGHRVVSGGGVEPPATSVREPWAVYETPDGNSATGTGPNIGAGGLTTGGSGEALFGYGYYNGGPVGINTTADFSIGFWREINGNSLTTGEGTVAAYFSMIEEDVLGLPHPDNDTYFQLGLNNFAAQATLSFQIYDYGATRPGGAGFIVVYEIESPPVGMHLFSLSVISQVGRLYMDGVQIGEPFPFVLGYSNREEVLNIDNSESADGASTSQYILANVGYTAAEWLYLYNGGEQMPYGEWEITP